MVSKVQRLNKSNKQRMQSSYCFFIKIQKKKIESIIASFIRIDVNKNEPSNTQERVICFRGQQENCIQACREVLRIMHEDAKNKNKTR